MSPAFADPKAWLILFVAGLLGVGCIALIAIGILGLEFLGPQDGG